MFTLDDVEHNYGGSDLITNAFLKIGNHIDEILEEKDDLNKIKNELNEQKKLNDENAFTPIEEDKNSLINPVSGKMLSSR